MGFNDKINLAKPVGLIYCQVGRKILFSSFSIAIASAAVAYPSPVAPLNHRSKTPISNTQSVATRQEAMRDAQVPSIAPTTYWQDPIAFNMGLNSQAGPNGTYHIGLSSIFTNNINLASANTATNSYSVEAWGQTGRWHGFALGGALTAASVIRQNGQPNTFSPTGILIPSQAYIDYKYKDTLELTGGNILLATPWVNSISSFPGATYANLNNTFQAVNANLQITPNLLVNAFYAIGYLQYPQSWYAPTTLYNAMGGPLRNMTGATTSGTNGVGAIWSPAKNYTFNLWYYQFINYANMWYTDNAYHLPLSATTSMDFAIQGLTENSSASSITNSTPLPGFTSPAGSVDANAIGVKWTINVPYNTITLAYNNVFGANGSYLNGGIVTPYTYGLETDPLYTTPALSSIAELGSGSAYLIKDTMYFLDHHLKSSLAFAQFYVNKVYTTQPNLVTEYDAAIQYTFPHTPLNIWARLVYLNQPAYAGGDLLQPRLIINYFF